MVSKIIGLYGYHGSGKSSVADILLRLYPNEFEVKHLADLLKEEASQFYGLPKEIFYSHTKKDKPLSLSVLPSDRTSLAICNAIGASNYFTPRDLLIAYGAFRRFYNEDYWVNKVVQDFVKENNGKILLIPDVRFINEVIEIKSKGGGLIKVIAEGIECQRQDDSEVQQNNFNPDLIIKSKMGLDKLEKVVKREYKKIIKLFNEN